MIMIRQSFLLLLICAMCFSVACKSDTKSSLVGKWKSTKASEGWEFKSDNKFARLDPLGFTSTGTYSVDGETVALTFDRSNETSKAVGNIKVKIAVRGDDMTLDDGERKYTYKRESANEKPESSSTLNTSTTNTAVTNTSNSSVPKQSSGVIQARYLLEYEYDEEFPSRPKKYEGKNVTVTGSFGEYSPQLPDGKTIWFSDKAELNGSRVACKIVDSEVKAATKFKKDQKITVNGTVGKYEHNFYLNLDNCKIVNQ